jgi:hypothetical protein
LQDQVNQEQLLGSIQQRIRQSMDLDTILSQTVKEVREFIQCDRVLIYRLESDGSGVIAVESTAATNCPLEGRNIKDPCFQEKHIEYYKQGCPQVVEDIYTAGLAPCYIELLASLEVRANLVAPIFLKQDFWGLFVAQNCYEPRLWKPAEIKLLQQLADQLGIAVQQTQIQQQVQQLEVQLSLMHKQAAELHDCLSFTGLMQRITEKIRDSLDEGEILQTAIKELADILKANCCSVELYSDGLTKATIVYDYTINLPLSQGLTRQVAEFPKIYEPLLRKQHLQSLEIVPSWSPKLSVMVQLACPIFDDQGIIGNLWVTRLTQETFNDLELKLVQHVANECAIAIRQARLHKLTQTHNNELEKLEHLETEFLRTLSHELRTPITTINLAVQTLEILLQQEGVLDLEIVPHLLQILHNECQRESKLIDDLLMLTYLETQAEPPTLIFIDLQTWLPPIVESFRERSSCEQQELKLAIASGIPLLETDITDLERIVTELINNACKFTPAGGSITVSVYGIEDTVVLSFSNSGVEIPNNELLRIFTPFYRILGDEPCKYGGTGLGLTLVRKLVKHLGASIDVESAAGKTTFRIKFPKAISL